MLVEVHSEIFAGLALVAASNDVDVSLDLLNPYAANETATTQTSTFTLIRTATNAVIGHIAHESGQTFNDYLFTNGLKVTQDFATLAGLCGTPVNNLNVEAGLGSGGIQAKISNYSLLSSDNRKVFTNEGASGLVTLTLPAVSSGGLKYGFVVSDGFDLKVLAAGTDTITLGSMTTLAGGYVDSSVVGTTLGLQSNGSSWMMTSMFGNWSVN